MGHMKEPSSSSSLCRPPQPSLFIADECHSDLDLEGYIAVINSKIDGAATGDPSWVESGAEVFDLAGNTVINHPRESSQLQQQKYEQMIYAYSRLPPRAVTEMVGVDAANHPVVRIVVRAADIMAFLSPSLSATVSASTPKSKLRL